MKYYEKDLQQLLRFLLLSLKSRSRTLSEKKKSQSKKNEKSPRF